MPTTKRECWETLIEEWESSGVSQKAFCEMRGEVYSTFTYWRRKIKENTLDHPLSVACYEVQPTQSLDHASRSRVFQTDGITLPLGNNAVVTIRGSVSLEQLESLVRSCVPDTHPYVAP